MAARFGILDDLVRTQPGVRFRFFKRGTRRFGLLGQYVRPVEILGDTHLPAIDRLLDARQSAAGNEQVERNKANRQPEKLAGVGFGIELGHAAFGGMLRARFRLCGWTRHLFAYFTAKISNSAITSAKRPMASARPAPT